MASVSTGGPGRHGKRAYIPTLSRATLESHSTSNAALTISLGTWVTAGQIQRDSERCEAVQLYPCGRREARRCRRQRPVGANMAAPEVEKKRIGLQKRCSLPGISKALRSPGIFLPRQHNESKQPQSIVHCIGMTLVVRRHLFKPVLLIQPPRARHAT